MTIRKLLRRSSGMLGGLLLLPGLYLLAGLAGGAIPAGGTTPARGIRIYVEDNGIHTGIVVPARIGDVNFDDLVRPGDFADSRHAGHAWRSFGWGERGFYLGTPTWADVKPATILAAALGSNAVVMHVDALPDPAGQRGVYPLTLSPGQYRRLAAHIRASFAPGHAPIAGYGPSDAFYPARGRYSAVTTCNSWTGAALRAAGVPMGAWTPFPVTVTAWL
ncbi:MULTISPECIES: TIGR02117 family protein [unclassified Sphingomonas]|uniref:TIGR02117 family protein n=1 Tax=unclassified Sphingomonas TaxID=196159 RepID=UPI001F331540|nr:MULTISPECIES: TIGR02117 family protein [unclassified Sphingomonas]